MKIKYLLTSIAVLVINNNVAFADNSDVVIVTNTQNQLTQLTKQEIKNLYMGAGLSYELKPIALPPQNNTRVVFNTKIVGLTESRVQSYWAQMRFTGRKKPPVMAKTEDELIKILINNETAVGYLPANLNIPSELKVIYTTSLDN